MGSILASAGDSGGPVFAYRNGEYELSGVISAVHFTTGHDIGGTSTFGDKTAIVNIAEYANQLSILEEAVAVPELSSVMLARFGLFQCLVVRRRGGA